VSTSRLRAGLALAVALALGLRLWHFTADLPDFLEEAIPFRKALDLWAWTGGRVDWNPHLFHYPSLTIYLHFLVQQAGYAVGHALGRYHVPADWFVSFLMDPTPMVVTARLVHIAADASAVLAAGLVAERLRRGSGVVAALLVALAPTLIGASRSIFTDTLMAALALWALERMLAWRERGGAGRLAAATVLVGLATGAKYPAAVLLLPLAWVLGERRGARGLALWLALAASALAVFVLTTPYAVLDFGTFRRDLVFVRVLAGTGHLGNVGAPGFAYHLGNLTRDVGWAGIGLALAALVVTAARWRSRGAAVAVALALVGFGLPIALARVEAERYLVPVIPLVAALAAAAACDVTERLAGRPRAVTWAALAGALLLPALIAGTRAGAAGSGTTQVAARRWCETHLGRGSLAIVELHGPHIATRSAALDVEANPIFRAASPALRARFTSRPWWRAVALPLAVVGPCTSLIQPARGAPVEVPIFPHVVDMNRLFYDPRLFAAADYVITSSAVRGRFAADPVRYRTENRLYGLLDSSATQVARFEARGTAVGPTLTVYRIGARARAALSADGLLDPLWWAAAVPAAYRRAADSLLVPGTPWTGGDVRGPDGAPAPWVLSLAGTYDEKLRPFAQDMALNLAELGRLEEARTFAEATLLVLPRDAEARIVLEAVTPVAGDSLARPR
jgi:hypothetical protein